MKIDYRIFAILLLAGCAKAPPGMQYANPNCVWRCAVHVVEVKNNDDLATLNNTSTATGGSVSRSGVP